MVFNTDETKLSTIAQVRDFLKATQQVSFSGSGDKDDGERYAHINRVQRCDYPRAQKLNGAWCRPICGYSRDQIKRLLARWKENRLTQVPMAKRSKCL
jgi:hypothetical protein